MFLSREHYHNHQALYSISPMAVSFYTNPLFYASMSMRRQHQIPAYSPGIVKGQLHQTRTRVSIHLTVEWLPAKNPIPPKRQGRSENHQCRIYAPKISWLLSSPCACLYFENPVR